MALVKLCDICKKECENRRRYELIERGIFKDYKLDICCNCIDRIKKEIKENIK